MSILNSLEFRSLRIQLRHLYSNKLAGKDYEVFLVSRFDGNDDTLRPYLSTTYSGHHDPSLYPAVRLQKGKGGVLREAETQGGGHAEEKFIRSLDEQGGMFGGAPDLIEVYVSRIPCASSSSPWRAHKPFESENMEWPAGCGPKLRFAMEVTPHIRWNLYYEDVYEGQTQANSEAWIKLMNKLPNAKAQRCFL